jgi:hypothetical protein
MIVLPMEYGSESFGGERIFAVGYLLYLTAPRAGSWLR